MRITRRLILAVALMAGIAPAIAQAPPPVPALPDTERRSSYTLSASTCNCSVGFALYGDSTDYANWITVWVNGAQMPQAGNWTVTSPSGSLATLPRPITDAVLNFTAAQTGTVQIVGARRPRRASQFSESRGVAARDLNQVLTDIIAQNRENWDRTNDVTGRAVLAPPGETLATLPKLASRANQGACFDSGGNLVPCVSVPSSSFSAGNGITFTGANPTVITNNIAAGSGISITGTNPLTISASSQTIGAKSYGAACDGVTDDTTALTNWMAAINGSASSSVVGELAQGNCLINSATLSTGLVITRSNVTIDGKGASITVTGATSMNMVFSSSDRSHVAYKNINFVGNNVASGTGFGVGGAIGFTNASANIQDLLVEGNSFSNFAGNYWVYIETLGSFSNAIQDIKVNRNSFFSQSGNCLGTTNIGINCSFVLTYGVGNSGGTSTPSPNSFVRGIRITNNYMRADYVKTGIQIFDNAQDIYIAGNQIYNNGQLGGIVNDVGSYAIMIYENESPSTTSYSARAIIEGNYIFNARDNCFYMAGQWNDSIFNGNVCNAQTSTATTTLPKGGISVNGALGTTIVNNRLTSIAGDGITLNAPSGTTTGQWLIANNYVSGGTNAAIRILNNGFTANNVSVQDNNVSPSSSVPGILVYVFPGGSYSALKIDGNNVLGGTYGIRFVADSGSLTLNQVSVSRNNVYGNTTYGIDISQVATATGGSVVLDGNTSCCSPSSANFNITNTISLVAQNNVCSLQSSGFCWTTAGAQGSMRNNSFDRTSNIVATVGAADLGRVKPTWTGSAQSVVQNLAATETGTSPNKYIVRDWFYNVGTAAWLDQRMLTGN